jgi:hypothetical protein
MINNNANMMQMLLQCLFIIDQQRSLHFYRKARRAR